MKTKFSEIEMSTKCSVRKIRVVKPNPAGRGQMWGNCESSLEKISKPAFFPQGGRGGGLETKILWTENFVEVSISPRN